MRKLPGSPEASSSTTEGQPVDRRVDWLSVLDLVAEKGGRFRGEPVERWAFRTGTWMEQYFCGIDLGTTNLKVLLSDGSGKVVAVQSCLTPRRRIGDDVLTDPAEILSAVEALLDDAWCQTGGRGRIAAIATAGVGEDGFILSAEGSPIGLSIPWFDRRAAPEADALLAECDVSARSGIAFEPTRTAAKWLWLARNAPTPPPGAVWAPLTDWPLIAWSGVPIVTEALAARSGCWDIEKRVWITEALAAAKAPPLPPVQHTGSPVGSLQPDSFPVRIGAADARTLAVSGGHDHPIAAAPIRAGYQDAIVDSLGTAELIHAEAPYALEQVEGLVRTVPGGPGMVSACLHVFELERYLSEFPPERLRAVLQGTAPADDMTSSIWARLETASMVSAEVLDRMDAAGVPSGDLFVTGGRARSDRFMQLRANVLGRTVTRVEEDELCGLGAAITAARGTGLTIVPGLAVRRFSPDRKAVERYMASRLKRRDELKSLLLHGPR